MAGNDFRFVTHWRVRGDVEEIYDVLADGPDLARWWPSVYLDVQELEHGGPDAVGRVIRLYTKGWLPYTLRWQFRITENNRPHGFALEAWGDFDGRGIWTFTQEGDYVDIAYDWAIAAEKPLLRRLSFLMKPVFAANHRWAMAQGEKSLKLELARRRAGSEAERAAVPPPPGATFKFLL
jgi:Polyketide cyclase / dehydrase and lipid transport